MVPEGRLRRPPAGLHPNVDNQGVAGLELEYNSLLTGQDGRVLSAKNAWGYDMPTDYDTYIQPVQVPAYKLRGGGECAAIIWKTISPRQ